MRNTLLLLEAQNKMLQEQNALLRDIRLTQQAATTYEAPAGCRMMTEHDLLLIVTAENVLHAVDRWNALNRPKKGVKA